MLTKSPNRPIGGATSPGDFEKSEPPAGSGTNARREKIRGPTRLGGRIVKANKDSHRHRASQPQLQLAPPPPSTMSTTPNTTATATAVRPSLGPMRDLVVVGGAAVGRRGSANYVGGCWRSSHIRCRKCAVGYAARNASAHHKAVHRQQRHHRQHSTWRSDHNRLLGSGGSVAASVMSSEAQNAHGARGTVGAVR